jgi:ornithine carbamoyltransferase
MGEWGPSSVPADPRAVPKDFVSVADWPREALEEILGRARELKALRAKGTPVRTLEGRSVALYFEKPSLRTHATFEVGVFELGAHPLFLPPGQVRIGARESIVDAAKNLSLWCHAIVARTFEHSLVAQLAQHASIPIINALTDELHPCQVMADALTIAEHGDLRTARLVWLGDGNNVTRSLIHLAGRLGLHLTVCTPESRLPDAAFVRPSAEAARREGGDVVLETDPRVAVRKADFVYTDCWYSMGEEGQAEERRRILSPYQVNEDLLSRAPAQARVLHCLPAHRGEEITDGVIDSDRSLVLPQAENRLHAQKAVLEAVLSAPGPRG